MTRGPVRVFAVLPSLSLSLFTYFACPPSERGSRSCWKTGEGMRWTVTAYSRRTTGTRMAQYVSLGGKEGGREGGREGGGRGHAE